MLNDIACRPSLVISTSPKAALISQVTDLAARLADAKESLERVDPKDEAGIADAQDEIRSILDEFQCKPVEFIPAGDGPLWRVPVSTSATISGYALVRADDMNDAIEVACRMAMQGEVVMTIDDGNHRRLDDFYCPDEGGVELVEPEPQPA